MQPIHSIEYELTSELSTEVHRTLVRWELRRGWRREMPVFVGAVGFTALIIWLALRGLMLPVVGGGLMCVVMLFVLGAVYRRWSMARGAAVMALLPLYTGDRRVRIEFSEESVRLDMERFRGEGAWTELDELVLFPSYWLLQLSNGGQILVPASAMSPELEAFICAKAEQVKAPVRQG